MISSINEVLDDLRNGKPVIIMDDEDRENEGDVIIAAQFCTPEVVNFMASNVKGLICVPLTEERAEILNLPPMGTEHTALHGTNFTVSVDYRFDTTTGISAQDRSKTIMALADENAKPDDFGRPGHIFPLRAVKGGVLKRAGHTEATVDLLAQAGLIPVGVCCEIMKDDGTMARRPDIEIFAEKFGLKISTVEKLIAYRFSNEKMVKCVAEANLPSQYGNFRMKVFTSNLDNLEHIALVKGEINPEESILVRVHSECMTGEVFGSLRCDCRDQLHNAMKMIDKAGSGILLYMRQEGRGIGLTNKIRAYALQDKGLDTVDANVHLGFPPDPRDYGIGAQILATLGVRKMKLITNNPKKRIGIESYGLKVTETVPIEIEPNEYDRDYLLTKKEKMGHILPGLEK